MVRVPKKVIDRMSKSVAKFQKVLEIAKDRDVNESDTVAIITDMLTEVLGYDKYLEITSELAIRGTYCDIAIKIEDKVQFLLEAKAIGIELKDNHLRQALNYGANHGIQWIILTNGVEWSLYRLRFEKPIQYDLICDFNIHKLDLTSENDLEELYILSKEGLDKNAREDYYEKIQSVNKYVIGNIILTDTILNTIRREVRKLADGSKVDIKDVENIVRSQVLKRDILDGEEADAAQKRIKKFYKKANKKSIAPQNDEPCEKKSEEKISFSDQLLQQENSIKGKD